MDDFQIATFTGGGATAVGDPATSRGALVLQQNRPNPFSPSTSIAFALPRAAAVDLGIYAVDGRRVATLVDANLPAGSHQAVWDGLDASAKPR